MAQQAPHMLYFTRADVESAGVAMAEVIETTELALREKGLGRADMPAKHWIAPSPERFFSAMTCALPAVQAVSCKWQSGSERNAALGLPYLTGLLILNDLETGMPVAIMDSTWITAQRTAAATAVSARPLAAPEPRVFGILGCGVQGRTNLEALRLAFPSISTVRAFDISQPALERYAAEMTRIHGVEVIPCAGPHEALDGADIVVTAGPIRPDGGRLIEPDWLKRGALMVMIDYDSYAKPETLQRADAVFTDDVPQLAHLKEHGYFLGAPDDIVEIGEVVAGKRPGRTAADQVIISVNMGVAPEDVTLARRVYDKLCAAGRGLRLEF
jgi:ornithine cyclodeaminase/alanine dehydrogenase-like protein (mu-crystallin family)